MPHKGRAAWRDKGAVRLIALLDMTLGVFLLGFYLIGGLMLNTLVFQVPKGPLSKISIIIISMILWAMIFFVTLGQVYVGYKLFIVTFQDALGPQVAVNRSLAWLRTSAFVFGLIILKLVYCLVRVPSPSAIEWVVCAIEIFYRLLGVYFVREFCDDLKHHIKIEARPLQLTVPSTNENEPPPAVIVVANHLTV